MKAVRISAGAGYAGDRIEPALENIRRGNVDYIMFECLAERTIALAQKDRAADPQKGYHETNKRWSSTIFVPEDGGHRHTFLINSHPAILDGFVSNYRVELEQLQANSDQAMSMGEMTM